MDSKEKSVQDATKYTLPESNNFTWKDAYSELKKAVLGHQPVILFGPPGTGKTKLLYLLKSDLENENKLGKFEVVQFHKKFSYEDFIEGFAPAKDSGFEKKDGVFKSFITNPSDADVDLFVIDEINRAEITTTFGELMFLIEDRDQRRVKTSHFGEELGIPAKVSIVGTMNTADRNIASLDFALRRRFKFIPVFPDYDVLTEWLNSRGFDFDEFSIDDYVKACRVINNRIADNRLMGRNMQLGHAMWVADGNGLVSKSDIVQLIQFEIIPQLEAYLGFGNENQLAEMLNSNVASKYLSQKHIDFEAVSALIRDLSNDSE